MVLTVLWKKRGKMNTVPTSEELVALFHQGILASEMARRFGLIDKTQLQLVEDRCVDLHNSGALDLLRLVESNALQKLNGTDFFAATRFFCQILPEIEEKPSRMMACVEALVTRGGEDMSAYQPNVAFRAWCQEFPLRASEVIAAARSGDDLANRHLAFALEAINAIAETRQIALEYDSTRRLSAIIALGRMQDDDPVSRAETQAAFSSILDSGSDDNLRANMLYALAAILARSQDLPSPEATAILGRLVEDVGDNTIHQAAQILWAHKKILNPEIVAILLQALASINPANKGTVEVLDLGLQALLDLGYDEMAIDFVTELFSRTEVSLELNEFDSFTRTLVSSKPERLSRVVVKWLLQGKPLLCDGLSNAIQGHDLEGPALNLRAEDLAISSSAQVFLCRKAIGWFFFKPTTAASVLVSILRICDDETALEVQRLLVETLLINYNGVRNYLEGLSPDDAAKCRVNHALEENEFFLSALRAIPSIKELRPSEHHRQIERKLRSDQMREMHKQAQSQSVLLSLVKHSVLLYGNRSLSFIKDDKDTLRPVEMDLKPYGVSFEMPRMEIVDPVGLDYTLRVFRAERMPS
jgi:hypothetical protein